MMRESFAYNLIKEEGLKEGREQGLQQGMLEDAREMVLEALVERFKMVPKDVEDAIRSIQSRIQLKELLRASISSQSLQQFRKLLDKAAKGT